ncbi:MAG TPA: GSCFA domain-containing protein, partial [Flavobacterium sp.]|nr:GSCFA domain-containing protein [Flavobacterium sp.]
MQFSTPIPIPKSNRPIDYHSKVVLLGSCFAVNMSEKFEYFKFRNTANPFGILFHPLAIEKFIGYAIDKKTFTEKDIFFHNERWHCFDAHSDVSRADKNDMLGHLNSVTKSANTQIAEATHIIITLGTAWVYTNI